MIKKILPTIIIILLTLGIAYYAYTIYFPKPMAAEPWPAMPVNITTVKLSNIPIRIQATGTLVANQQVAISPEYGGKIAKINFQDGETVQAGHLLFELDTTSVAAAYQSALADLKYKQQQYNRDKILYERHALARQTLDQAESQLAIQLATVKSTADRLSKMSLTAPFAGQLTDRQVDVGQYVNIGKVLVQLVDIHSVKVSFQVPAEIMAHLILGQSVEVHSNAYPQHMFAGRVTYIAPVIDEATRTIKVEATIDNAAHLLKPGLFVNVAQIVGEKNKVITLPLEALVSSIDGDYVYRVLDNKAVKTLVKVGDRDAKRAEILKGLKTNDIVVTAGQLRLNDGMKVKIEPSPASELID